MNKEKRRKQTIDKMLKQKEKYKKCKDPLQEACFDIVSLNEHKNILTKYGVEATDALEQALKVIDDILSYKGRMTPELYEYFRKAEDKFNELNRDWTREC